MNRIHNRIREILENTPGLTQKGLAERMGLNPAAVNRMLYGRRNIMAEEIPLIEDYLGVRLNLSAPIVPANIEYRQEASIGRRGFSDAPAESPPSEMRGRTTALVPVYGAPYGEKKNLDITGGEIIDWVARHPAQAGIAQACAIYVPSHDMEPRYFHGELVYLHPGRPPETGRDCVIELKSGITLLRRLVRQDETNLYVAQFNPPAEKPVPKDQIKTLFAVVGRG